MQTGTMKYHCTPPEGIKDFPYDRNTQSIKEIKFVVSNCYS